MKKCLFILCSVLLLLTLCLGAMAEASGDSWALNLYWSGSADIATSDVWSWLPNKDGHGYLFEACDYGFVCHIGIPAGTEEVGFIVRVNCSDPGGASWGNATKDYEQDRMAIITGPVTDIYLKSGEEAQYGSSDGGKTLEPIRVFKLAALTSLTEIRYTVAPATRITDLSQIRVLEDETPVEVASLSSLNNNVITGVITLAEPMDLSHNYSLTIDGYGTQPVLPTAVFDTPAFTEAYTYDGNDLGAVITGDTTTFKVWAPTASDVRLNLYEAGDSVDAYETDPMVREDKGIWSFTAPCGHGTYYTYTVTTALGTYEVMDPYAVTAGVNGDRAMVTDLALTDPEGFDADAFRPAIDSYEDAVIWEVHVRDFSSALPGSAWPGKYLALTETGLKNASGQPVGLDYLKELGITHVHLQPIFDYATVDESNPESGYNWGYDPKNYNVPEGSYSTDPFHGETRVTELKKMVQTLHENGIGVVMDVVYNHTSGIDSCFNRLVPYYYYRFAFNGDPSNGSGCGNETASERAMFRKYMVDSVLYWAREYHIDGFRFDLMALHDTETMQAIEQALHAQNPTCLIYGEGWTGGTSALHASRQTTQANIAKIVPSEGAIGGVAVFNDAIRDGLKGSVFDAKDKGFISGSANKTNANRVIFGLGGGKKIAAVAWRADNAGVINYMSCHDNMTLWDKLTASRPDADEGRKATMQRLGAAAVFLSRGTPFMLAGEEMLRTKQGDSNSYMSSDAVNHIDWESLTPGSAALEMSEYYRFLISLRKDYPFLTESDVTCEVLGNSAITVTWTHEDRIEAIAILNPDNGSAPYTLPDGASTYLYGGKGTVEGTLTIPPLSWVLLVR